MTVQAGYKLVKNGGLESNPTMEYEFILVTSSIYPPKTPSEVLVKQSNIQLTKHRIQLIQTNSMYLPWTQARSS